MKKEKDEKKKITFGDVVGKASDIGKKVAVSIQKSAKDISEHTKKVQQEKKVKRYNPLFPEVFHSEEYNIPNLIAIVDDATRRGIEVCEGAIGWTQKVGDVETLYLYDEYVSKSNIKFVPFATCDAVYCVDPFDRMQFIDTDHTFERTTNEKLAELEHIAYSLEAKSCSIEIVEEVQQSMSAKATAGAKKANANTEMRNDGCKKQSIKNVSYFEGARKVKMPRLKWFAFDENIKGLIDMRRSNNNAIKSKVLEIRCSSAATMSRKTAVAVDKIKAIKANLSAEVKALKEQNSKLVFQIDF